MMISEDQLDNQNDDSTGDVTKRKEKTNLRKMLKATIVELDAALKVLYSH